MQLLQLLGIVFIDFVSGIFKVPQYKFLIGDCLSGRRTFEKNGAASVHSNPDTKLLPYYGLSYISRPILIFKNHKKKLKKRILLI